MDITDEMENEITDIWAKAGFTNLEHENLAVLYATDAFPDISELTVSSLYFNWLRDTGF